jgi:hypothetical protein
MVRMRADEVDGGGIFKQAVPVDHVRAASAQQIHGRGIAAQAAPIDAM